MLRRDEACHYSRSRKYNGALSAKSGFKVKKGALESEKKSIITTCSGKMTLRDSHWNEPKMTILVLERYSEK